jgi:hypothetical protein
MNEKIDLFITQHIDISWSRIGAWLKGLGPLYDNDHNHDDD